MKHLYLSLIQGTEQIAKEYKTQQDFIFHKIKNYLTNFITYSNDEMVESIDLALASRKKMGFTVTRPARYEKGNIIAYKYEIDKLPSDEKMILDLNHMITIMDHIVNNIIKQGGVDKFYKNIINDVSYSHKPQLIVKEEPKDNDYIALVDEPERHPKKEKISKPATQVTRKIDYIAKAKRDLDTGITGENLIVMYEKEKLISCGLSDLVSKVVHVSTVSDSHGYDIESYDESGKKILIEVKTTTGDEREPFFLSVNEHETYLKNIGSYFIYRVYNIGSTPKFFIISDLSKYNLIIQGYRVE